jgi:hypothetical protein
MKRAASTLPPLGDFEVHEVAAPTTSLLDAVDRLVEKGAVIHGDAVIAIADVDLIRLNLNVLLAAVETLDQATERRAARTASFAPLDSAPAAPALRPGRADVISPARPERSAAEGSAESKGANALTVSPAPPPAAASEAKPARRIEIDPKDASKGVAKLVLTLVEFIRQLLERQAIRRMEGGRVPDAAVERMGEALARLEAKVLEMKKAFGLEGEALDLDLGPLGRLNGPGEDQQRAE